MGAEDYRMMEDALNDLREQNQELRKMNAELKEQNYDLKEFFKHMDHAISSYPRYNYVIKAL